MPMKVGFSTSVCPQWDIRQVAERAETMGFYGVELGAVAGAKHLPAAPDFATPEQVDAVRAAFADRGVEIVGIATSDTILAATVTMAANARLAFKTTINRTSTRISPAAWANPGMKPRADPNTQAIIICAGVALPRSTLAIFFVIMVFSSHAAARVG